MSSLADAGGRLQQRRVSVRAKFCIALAAALAWLLFSIIVSQPWLEALAAATHPLFALWAISFIAYNPGVHECVPSRKPARGEDSRRT
jgi:hypothetical protein